MAISKVKPLAAAVFILLSGVARAEAARAEVARTRDVFNEALAAIGIGPFLADEDRVTDFLP